MSAKIASKEELQADYLIHKPRSDAFLSELLHQFDPLISGKGIKLGVPIEGRVKEWSSLADKLERKTLALTSCCDLPDLIGVRAITLFSRDEDTLCKLIEKTFLIQSMEDKAEAMPASNFGYISRHFIVKIPKAWRKVPAFAGLNYTVEIQVRTLSQHLWAAASHVLQYKKEADVPAAVTRSIHRVAALLETVDLEFERVLDEREQYSKSQSAASEDAVLDADNLRILLDATLPPQNKTDSEPYSDLISDLCAMTVTTVGQLKELVEKHKKTVLEKDASVTNKLLSDPNAPAEVKARADRGVWFTHVGLTRGVLSTEFGSKWKQHVQSKAARSTAPAAAATETKPGAAPSTK